MTKPYCDVSHWQGVIDYPTLISKADGVIIRAGGGTGEDPRWRENADGMEQAGPDYPLGAYWYVLENVNGAWQAEAFADVYLEGGYEFDFLVADFEDNSDGLSPLTLRTRYKLFLETLADLLPGIEIVIYTGPYFWKDNIGVAGWEQDYRLWIAHYGVTNPMVPAAWDDYWLHQYSADGNGKGAEYGVSSDDIDLNKLNPAYVPPPPPDPDPQPEPDCEPRPVLVCQVPVLNIRSGPGISYTDVGDLPGGAVVEVYELAVNGPTSIWAKIEPDSDRWCAVLYGNAVYLK